MNNLFAQEQFTNKLHIIINNLESKYHKNTDYWNHEHICTFKMLCHGDLEEAKKQCQYYRARNLIVFPKNWPKPKCAEDYCDFCDMMNYIALDEKGRIMYVKRTSS